MSVFSKPYRDDRNNRQGSILLYIRKKIVSKSTPNNLEYLPVEIDLRKKKWLLICWYNPHKSFCKGFFTAIKTEIDSLSSRSENFPITKYFNCQIHEESIIN